MRHRMLCFLLFGIMITFAGIGSVSVSALNKPLIAENQLKQFYGTLKVISSKTAINLGDRGYITIQGKPGVKYTIKTYFRKGDKLYHVAKWRTADADGMVTFEWDVAYDTVPGTNKATVSGGGEMLDLSHTVFE